VVVEQLPQSLNFLVQLCKALFDLPFIFAVWNGLLKFLVLYFLSATQNTFSWITPIKEWRTTYSSTNLPYTVRKSH